MKRKELLIIASAFVIIFAGLIGGLAVSQNLSPEEKQGISLIKQALTPAQIRVILDYIKAHKDEARDMLQKGIAQHDKDQAFMKALNITPAQEDKLAGIAASRIEQIKPLADSLYASGVALERAVLAQQPNPAGIRSAALDLGQDIGAAALVATGMVKEARQVLTPDQVSLIENKIKEADAQGRAEMDKMPARADEGFTVVKAVDITPEQITGIIKLAKASEPFFEQRGKIHEARMEMELAQVLTSDQMKTLKNFQAAQEKIFEPKAKEYEAVGIKTWNDFKLSKVQLDALVALVESNKSSILTIARSISDSSLALRNEVLAANDDAKILAAADVLGEGIVQAGLLGSDMAQEARKILSAGQVDTVLKLVAYAEKEIYDWLQIIPDQAQGALKLRADLNITADQRKGLEALGEKEYQKEIRHAERMLEMDPSDLLLK